MDEFYGDNWAYLLVTGENPEPQGASQQTREPGLVPATIAGAPEVPQQASEPGLVPAAAAGAAEAFQQASEPGLEPAAAAGAPTTPLRRFVDGGDGPGSGEQLAAGGLAGPGSGLPSLELSCIANMHSMPFAYDD